MREFLDELISHIADASVVKYIPGKENEAINVNGKSIEAAIAMIDSLGENARRMLEIGIVQGELVKLGFEHFLPYISCLIGMGIMIDFDCDKVRLLRHDIDFNYASPTWQEDLLTRVKELIK